jgi:hypothetical protein
MRLANQAIDGCCLKTTQKQGDMVMKTLTTIKAIAIMAVLQLTGNTAAWAQDGVFDHHNRGGGAFGILIAQRPGDGWDHEGRTHHRHGDHPWDHGPGWESDGDYHHRHHYHDHANRHHHERHERRVIVREKVVGIRSGDDRRAPRQHWQNPRFYDRREPRAGRSIR